MPQDEEGGCGLGVQIHRQVHLPRYELLLPHQVKLGLVVGGAEVKGSQGCLLRASPYILGRVLILYK